MLNEILDSVMAELNRRMLPESGFADHAGGDYRSDATAWAILAFKAFGKDAGVLQPLQARLASEQLNDGSVCISLKYPDVFWPTSLAILAWHGSTDQIENQTRAVK